MFVVSGDSRLHGDGSQTYSQDQLADHFEAVCHDYCELAQHDFTFSRLAKGEQGASTCSRIDRIYCSLHPSAFEEYRMQVVVKGGWERERVASDHRAVILLLDIRTAYGCRRIRSCAVPHLVSQELLRRRRL